MPESPYLAADDLSIGYHTDALARGIRFSVTRGEILVLIGPNGAGKSTLLKTIIRQIAPLGGAVLLNGHDIAGYHRSDLAKEMASVQTMSVSTELQTVREVVSAGRYPHTGILGRLSSEDEAKIRHAMERTDTLSLADRRFATISDGQRQRVLLARALCQEPSLLVLDEPTSFLDVHYKLEFLSLLQQLTRKEKLAVLISMHELDLAQRIADRVITIDRHGNVHCDTADTIFTAENISSLFGINHNQYQAASGSAELPRPAGTPNVFIIGGGGYGIPVYRRLQREGTPFVAGILWDNDVEYPIARALAHTVITAPAFTALTPALLEEARKWIRSADTVICALPPIKMQGLAQPLLDLCEAIT